MTSMPSPLDEDPFMTTSPDLATGDIILPAHCGTAVAEDILARLVITSDQEQDIHINAAAVESIGQGVMQLLVAAHIDAKRVGQAFTIEAPSPAFLERVRSCQLAATLELPEPTPTGVEDKHALVEDAQL